MQPNYLLDTVAWLRYFHRPDELSARSRRVLGQEPGFGLASISLWEVSLLVAKGRLKIPESLQKWFDSSLPGDMMKVFEIDSAVAIEANSLPGKFHGDPADRLIVPTARCHGLTLATSDRRIIDYRRVKTLSTR